MGSGIGGAEVGLGEIGKSERKVGQKMSAEFEKRSKARYALSWLQAVCANASVSTLLVVTMGIAIGNELSDGMTVGYAVSICVSELSEVVDLETFSVGSGKLSWGVVFEYVSVGGEEGKIGSSLLIVVANVVGWPNGPVVTMIVVLNVNGKVSTKGKESSAARV